MQHLKRVLPPKSGTTLIELSCVIALLGIILCLSIGLLSMQSSFKLRTELDRLQVVITYLRRKAMIENKVMKIEFSKEGYRADKAWQLAKGISFDILPKVKGPPADPKKPLSHAITFKNNTLYLYPDGTVSAGTVYLTDSHTLYALSSDASAISRIRCYRYREKWDYIG